MKPARREVLRHGAAWCLGAGLLAGCRPAGVTSLRGDIAGGWVGAQVDRGHAWRDGKLKPSAAGEPVRQVHTLIVGAGVAGLSAARGLMRAGIDDFAVIDLEDEPGGNARGHRMAGLPCPLGAHYLPVPDDGAEEVAVWLAELGLITRQSGRWVGDERHLVHSPHERLFVPEGEGPTLGAKGFWPGQWHEGLLPEARAPAVQADLRRLRESMQAALQGVRLTLPTWRTPWSAGLTALDELTFAGWLAQQGIRSREVLWWLDYACRDDYGAGLSRVSAWAGLQYLSSRHGLGLGNDGNNDSDDAGHGSGVLTWPDGNAWLVRRLSEPLGARWQGGLVVTRVEAGRHDVLVSAVSARDGRTWRWQARHVLMALPLMIAQRLLPQPLSPLGALRSHLAQAPWLVSNILFNGALPDRAGAPLSWDNVPFSMDGGAGVPMPSLGYVNARHQELAQPVGPSLLTHYWALGGQSAEQGVAMRRALLKDDWRAWAQRVAADLARVHPEWPALIERMDLMRWGHAMAIPVPGLRSHPALAALWQPQGRLHFAHSDLSAYSVFEEAFGHGLRAAQSVARASGMSRRMA